MEMNFILPTKIVTGANCVAEKADLLEKFSKKCIIVTGKSSAKKCGALDDVTGALEAIGTKWCVFDKIEQNPSYLSCKTAADIARDFGAEYVIGIGGGSPLDAAKAVAVLAADETLDENGMYRGVWDKKPLPIVCVGTTAGTGSEVTPVSVITNSKGMKKSFKAVEAFPSLSFGDPKYTLSLHPDFTRSTAIDALCHCVESFFNKTSNDMSETFALRGINIIAPLLEKTKGDCILSYEDREALYCASLYGGLAISVTGTAFPHAMSYYLTENHAVAHGNACGVFIPAFLEFNQANAPEKTADFFSRICVTKEKLVSLITENLKGGKNCAVSMSDAEIASILPRYDGNASFSKCLGNADSALAREILTKLFVQ